jgi:hypothetical protein
MAQGDNKTGQKGTNAMFVMTREDIAHAHAAGKLFTYANPVVDYRPQKEDPYRIRIMAGGNLVTYEGNASVRTAHLDTAKMHWNSVISTKDARYMCPDIKNFYLTAKLEYFEYMIVDRRAIQLERVGGRGMGVYRNETHGVGTATGRDSCE